MKSNGGVDAEPAVGRDLNLAEVNRASRSESATESILTSPRATEVADGALHPRESSSRRNAVEPGRKRSANQSASIRVRNQDVRLDFTVRVAAGVEFVSRVINDEIKAASLGGNRRSIRVCPVGIPSVAAHSVNGRANISTGYAQAQILGREINTRLAEANRTAAVEFKTADRTITLDLLQILRARLAEETFNDEEVSAESPRTLKLMIQRTMPPALAEDAH
jgi:hypothetical protein